MKNSEKINQYIDLIKKKSNFLLKRGFVIKSITEYSISYCLNEIIVKIFIGRRDEDAEVGVFYPRENELGMDIYKLGWIINVQRYLCGEKKIFSYWKGLNQIDSLLVKLDFMEKNYDRVMDKEFCIECYKIVSKNYENGKWLELKRMEGC